MDRRTFLRLSGATVAALSVGALTPQRAGAAGSFFLHGVASGDPSPDGVVLWTRVTPMPDAVPGSGLGPAVSVGWDIAEDPGFRRVVARGERRTGADWDHTVKVEVEGLRPDTYYWYRFSFDGTRSAVGRTRTAPPTDFAQERVCFGVVSCANLEGGYFSAYRDLASRADELHAVVHLGDYLYEYGSGDYGPGPRIKRLHEPAHAIYSLSDYRMRHAQYKRDPDLQRLHAAVPFVVTWDDHEIADDAWSGGSKETPTGAFPARVAAARQAYAEWMPVRDLWSAPLYRKLTFGRLVDLSMLDLRSYRTKQPTLTEEGKPAGRTITGDEQLGWLIQGLTETDAVWRLVGNPDMISPLIAPQLPYVVTAALSRILPIPPQGSSVNRDQWDGYPGDRDRLLSHVYGHRLRNVSFLTGDIHTSWAAQVPLEYGDYPNTPVPATELICPSVTAESGADLLRSRRLARLAQRALVAKNPHFQHSELVSHGYSLLDVRPEGIEFSWHYVSDRTRVDATVWQAAVARIASGDTTVRVGSRV
ncbi:phosphodiesterase/alkaline phosphatase D [Longimycelium tulufanense]|uniref:Phosphodiesterase/alkaline phosphatase D n=1 Tax=Longimycelium tulufanense TaxID=907463 RepID=A0A8J3FTJ1_9PSEU|nr:alkaline phosphatase D family protein [Longimycelium tulufanense]GGM46602.1 phosphodiesterase/alkaline phosphatase D [Longimycelium tulufanense]